MTNSRPATVVSASNVTTVADTELTQGDSAVTNLPPRTRRYVAVFAAYGPTHRVAVTCSLDPNRRGLVIEWPTHSHIVPLTTVVALIAHHHAGWPTRWAWHDDDGAPVITITRSRSVAAYAYVWAERGREPHVVPEREFEHLVTDLGRITIAGIYAEETNR